MHQRTQFRLLTLHAFLYQLPVTLAGGFVGAYLLKSGFSLPAALAAYAAILAVRFVVRLAALKLVGLCGFRSALVLGACVCALQFPPLLRATEPRFLLLWVLAVAVSDALYWPVFHAASAVTNTAGARGREMGVRQILTAVVAIAGPLLGGWILTRFGPGADFLVAALLCLVSLPPVLLMHRIHAGAVPTILNSVRAIDRRAIAVFSADGWITAGLAMAWPMVLFTSLGSAYGTFGLSNALAAAAGAVTGFWAGHGIDRGHRDRYITIVSVLLAAGFLLRAGTVWSPIAASIANATGAAVGGLYTPLLMSMIYDRAKLSGAAYRFHLALEAGWDIGCAGGCLAGAAAAWISGTPSLSVLPAMLGVAVIYAGGRSGQPKLRAARAFFF